mmetsp:Transcript_18449/g.59539  ORF Transcript_18449/g.59539 Transcript_18449/m.59539 type:complete len:223 (+) Transcript_18449:130-798(+)
MVVVAASSSGPCRMEAPSPKQSPAEDNFFCVVDVVAIVCCRREDGAACVGLVRDEGGSNVGDVVRHRGGYLGRRVGVRRGVADGDEIDFTGGGPRGDGLDEGDAPEVAIGFVDDAEGGLGRQWQEQLYDAVSAAAEGPASDVELDFDQAPESPVLVCVVARGVEAAVADADVDALASGSGSLDEGGDVRRTVQVAGAVAADHLEAVVAEGHVQPSAVVVGSG